jgi:hypothetical protein
MGCGVYRWRLGGLDDEPELKTTSPKTAGEGESETSRD